MEKNKQNKLVSIIINCFNSELFIEEAIRSVISQHYQDWEIILWDNQSVDKTSSIVKAISDNRIRYFLALDFSTLSKARCLAIEQAKGEFIAFLDSDDYWHPDKLALQMDHFEKEKSVGMVHTNFSLVSDNNAVKALLQFNYYAKIKPVSYTNKNIYRKLLFGNFIIFSSLVIKKEVYETIGGINELFNQNEDYELLLKAIIITNASCIGRELTYYRIHSNNQSQSNQELSYLENKVIFQTLSEKLHSRIAYHRNLFRYNIFLLRANQKSVFFLLNPINWLYILEYLIIRILR